MCLLLLRCHRRGRLCRQRLLSRRRRRRRLLGGHFLRVDSLGGQLRRCGGRGGHPFGPGASVGRGAIARNHGLLPLPRALLALGLLPRKLALTSRKVGLPLCQRREPVSLKRLTPRRLRRALLLLRTAKSVIRLSDRQLLVCAQQLVRLPM